MWKHARQHTRLLRRPPRATRPAAAPNSGSFFDGRFASPGNVIVGPQNQKKKTQKKFFIAVASPGVTSATAWRKGAEAGGRSYIYIKAGSCHVSLVFHSRGGAPAFLPEEASSQCERAPPTTEVFTFVPSRFAKALRKYLLDWL